MAAQVLAILPVFWGISGSTKTIFSVAKIITSILIRKNTRQLYHIGKVIAIPWEKSARVDFIFSNSQTICVDNNFEEVEM